MSTFVDIRLQDCLECVKSLADNSIDLVLTDPPYGNVLAEKWDSDDAAFSLILVSELSRVLKDTGNIYVWCGIGEKSNSLFSFHQRLSTRFVFKDVITWKKRRGIGMRRGWLYTREEILWFVKDNKKFVWNTEHQYSKEPNEFSTGMSGTEVKPFKRISNVWTDIPEVLVKPQGSHPASKPVDALRRIIEVHTSVEDVVLDPFMGSGSTGIAAAQLNRSFIGADTNPVWFKESKIKLGGCQ